MVAMVINSYSGIKQTKTVHLWVGQTFGASNWELLTKVAIPSDPTNSARALLLLQSAGLVTLKDPTGLTNTPFDVTSNPKNIQITELEAAQIPRSIQDLDAAVINANYALPAGLNPTKDGLFVEKADSPYANLLSVNPGDENKPAIQKLAKALQSPEVKKFIEEHYKGAIIPAF